MTKAQIIDEIIAKKQEELAKAESNYSKVKISRGVKTPASKENINN